MREKAILISANLNNESKFDQLMAELENLVDACDMSVEHHVIQNIKQVNVATYIGQGKVDEVLNAIGALEAQVVVFNHELSPTQQRNLERHFQIPVLDRTALILEIFSKRAKTREARLQVELAELQYLLPRLAGSYAALGRQGGGSGTHNKGSGEKKIELDRRRAEENIYELERTLAQIQKDRHTQRRKRQASKEPVIALVGYTNAGKSTLLNAFLKAQHAHVEKEVFEKNMLFATLDTSVRRVTLPNKRNVFLTDTVGFVSHLPHGLVKAFGSTLEEVVEADLLIHVVDISSPDYELQMTVTEATLKEIGADGIPSVKVFNKSDLVYPQLPFEKSGDLYVSAKESKGLELIGKTITDMLFGDEVACEFLIPYEASQVQHQLSEQGLVTKRINTEYGTLMQVNCSKALLQQYKQFAVDGDPQAELTFKAYNRATDYQVVSDFLKRIYMADQVCTNWLEARWEYMHYHPVLNAEILPKIGLWFDEDKLIAMVNPEADFGDVYFAIDPEYPQMKRRLVTYAEQVLYKCTDGQKSLRLFIPETDQGLQAIAATMGYDMNTAYAHYRGYACFPPELLPNEIVLPKGYALHRLDEVYDLAKIDRVLWKGFDHEGEPSGDLSDRVLMHSAPNFRKDLTFVVEAPDGEYAAFSGIWLDDVNHTAYIEPVATAPKHRRIGAGKAAVYACMLRCAELGATSFHVGSGQDFYYRIGFEHTHYTWPWCKTWA